MIGCDGRSVIFAHDLDQTVRNAEAAAARFRASVDHYIGQAGIDAPAGSAEPPAATWRHSDAPSPDLPADNLVGVIWATGFTADRSWLPVDALTAKGEPRHTRGVSAPPGLLFLGLKWQHRRSSHTIDGVGRDSEYLAEHILARFAERAARARSERPIRQEAKMQRTIRREGVAA